MSNLDERTVAGFGEEWSRFDQQQVPEQELERLFSEYFSEFPWARLPADAVGFDMGCGSGRWARFVAPRVGTLHCIDASDAALSVARGALAQAPNVQFHRASVGELHFPAASMDFGYSLGVLHHVPDTAAAIAACARLLKPGAPLLLYLYYRFDNRPTWFRKLWELSDLGRRAISKLPLERRHLVTDVIAASVYWPLARGAQRLERLGVDVSTVPLAAYRDKSFYTMRTDALDRFGTGLEQRFTRLEIESMMRAAGLERIRFRDGVPFWCAVGFRA
ncbi:MAG: class I SAM-dependent methyltransferase [Myxococcaceae bacterium]|nr:class I SAM-dependent methyltransferase [Myxococcaceae bacterium]